MAITEYLSRVKFKRDTSSNWTQYNPVLLNGEIILVDTENGELRAKIGDGEKRYTQLPFNDEAIKNLIVQHNVSETAHENMGWITSDSGLPSEPTLINADTLGGVAANEYATKEYVKEKFSTNTTKKIQVKFKVFNNSGLEAGLIGTNNEGYIEIEMCINEKNELWLLNPIILQFPWNYNVRYIVFDFGQENYNLVKNITAIDSLLVEGTEYSSSGMYNPIVNTYNFYKAIMSEFGPYTWIYSISSTALGKIVISNRLLGESQ